MNFKNAFWLCLFVCVLSCSAFAEDRELPYVLMQDDLAALKTDFNDAAEKVRLVFVVGPT